MCKFSQLACRTNALVSRVCWIPLWHFGERFGCLNIVTSHHLDVPRDVEGPHKVAGLIKAYSDTMPKLAQKWLCLGIWITPFLSSPLCPKTMKKGIASTADSGTRVTAPPALGRVVCFNPVPEAKFLFMWKMYFHYGSGVNLATESSSSSFPRLYGILELKFFNALKLNWGVFLSQGCPSFLRSYYRLSWVNGLPFEHLAADDLFCHLSAETTCSVQDTWALKEETAKQ